jgi:adrenodoxin-NADP+ reductase
MLDAYAVAETISSDWLAKDGIAGDAVTLASVRDGELKMNPFPHPDEPPPEIRAGLAEGMVTEYQDWKAVDCEEVKRGEKTGKERERMGWEDARAFLAAKSS